MASKLSRVSHCVIKSLVFSNIVQPINLIVCNIIEIIEQNIFDHADFSLRSKFSFSGQNNIFI